MSRERSRGGEWGRADQGRERGYNDRNRGGRYESNRDERGRSVSFDRSRSRDKGPGSDERGRWGEGKNTTPGKRRDRQN